MQTYLWCRQQFRETRVRRIDIHRPGLLDGIVLGYGKMNTGAQEARYVSVE